MIPKISELLKQPETMCVMCAEACGIPKHARFYAQDHGGMRYFTYTTRAVAEQMFAHYGKPEHPIEDLWIAGLLKRYDESLDAMAEAEATLTDEEHSLFRAEIVSQVTREFAACDTSRAYFRALYERTAIQRLAAWLIAKGLAQP